MAYTIKEKDPDDILDYGWDYAAPVDEGGPWLTLGDTIVTSIWFVAGTLDGSDLIEPPNTLPADWLHVDSDSHDDTKTVVWVSQGAPGTEYVLTNRITTQAGRTKDKSFRFKIKES